MKVKCSPNPGGPGTGPTTSTHSSLKIVDHHRQLQQHTGSAVGYNTPKTPSQHATYIPPPSTSTDCPLSVSSCTECTVGYCCNLQSCCLPTPSHTTLPTPPPLLPIPPTPHIGNNQYTASSLQHSNLEDQPEFVSIDDEKVKQYLMKFGQQRKLYLDNTKITRVTTVLSPSCTEQRPVRPIVYEIIELDDEGEREKLKQIKEQAEQRLAFKKAATPSIDINFASRHTKSLNISLIPKISENHSSQEDSVLSNSQQVRKSVVSDPNHKIIAEINLIDSSDDETSVDDGDDHEEEEYYDDETLPLTAVSCELDCDDDDDDDDENQENTSKFGQNTFQQVAKNRSVSTKTTNEHLLIRWEEYEGQRERVFFECFLCGKKVQSSYNLRRHMMIHTGNYSFA